jgi:hypothetical protein
MTAKFATIRRFTLSLPEVTEAPHFQFSSFRVKGKIFATVPPGETLLHIFVEDEEREMMVAINPQAYEKLWWGKKVVGLRVTLAHAKLKEVQDLLRSAWLTRAPKKLAASQQGK